VERLQAKTLSEEVSVSNSKNGVGKLSLKHRKGQMACGTSVLRYQFWHGRFKFELND
jgi:hypothetical protein